MPSDPSQLAALAALGVALVALAACAARLVATARAAARLRGELADLGRTVAGLGGLVEHRSGARTVATPLPASLARLDDGAGWEQGLRRRVAPGSRAALAARDARLASGEASDVILELADEDGWSATCRELVLRADAAGVGRVLLDATASAAATARLEQALAEAYEARIVAERERAAARRLAATDVVTGTHNRASLLAATATAVLEGDPTRRVALMIVELDRFAGLAESIGQVAADRVLADAARRIGEQLAPGELLGRWDREQLAVLVPGAPPDAALRARGRVLRSAIADGPFPSAGPPVAVSAAVAIAAVDAGGDVEGLVADAGRTLRQARLAADGVALASDAPQAVADASGLQRTAASIAQVVEIREGVPSGHGQRVASLADAIARELDLPEVLVARCRLVGWLHDVGMVAVPDAIVRKPAPLGVAELTTMRTHAPVGEQLVRRMPLLAEAAPGVRHHHERWDGLGYPDGIAGTAIPIEARVVAAADAWVAMREPRPFRPPLGRDRCLSELRSATAAQLDPDVVDALLRIVEREGVAGPQH